MMEVLYGNDWHTDEFIILQTDVFKEGSAKFLDAYPVGKPVIVIARHYETGTFRTPPIIFRNFIELYTDATLKVVSVKNEDNIIAELLAHYTKYSPEDDPLVEEVTPLTDIGEISSKVESLRWEPPDTPDYREHLSRMDKDREFRASMEGVSLSGSLIDSDRLRSMMMGSTLPDGHPTGGPFDTRSRGGIPRIQTFQVQVEINSLEMRASREDLMSRLKHQMVGQLARAIEENFEQCISIREEVVSSHRPSQIFTARIQVVMND